MAGITDPITFNILAICFQVLANLNILNFCIIQIKYKILVQILNYNKKNLDLMRFEERKSTFLYRPQNLLKAQVFRNFGRALFDSHGLEESEALISLLFLKIC